ncbi:restriction endonuclease subunit S [Pseudomonas fluorescens]|uniref:restriction endonuclease subunit S n=1 Tax=Pseudomonas fluorescens TaxID=294 RepID=UPI00352613BE
MAVKPGYKQTEVGVIPDEWQVSTLQDACQEPISYGIVQCGPHLNSGIPYIRVSDMDEPELNVDGMLRTSPSIASRFGRSTVQEGDLVYALRGKLGEVRQVRADVAGANLTQGTARLSPNKKVLSDYFLWALRNPPTVRQAEIEAKGTTFREITLADLRKIKVLIPPLSEQLFIATALSDVDALLGALERLTAKKRDLKQATMQQLLTGQTRLPGFYEEWMVKRLGDVARIQRGASPRPIDSPVWFDQNSSVGWVRISDVTKSGMYLRETTQRLSPLGVQHSRPVARGSLIMSICATVGRPVITKIDVCIHDGFVVFDDLQADKLFIYYTLKWIEPDWSKHGQTGSQMNLNTGLITGTEVSLPPLPEQAAIAAVLSDMDAELAALEQRLAKARALKQGMMQELLTGRTRLL